MRVGLKGLNEENPMHYMKGMSILPKRTLSIVTEGNAAIVRIHKKRIVSCEVTDGQR
jgi:hypothetical protein